MSAQRPDWTGKDTAECVGMLLLTAGALAACTGNLSIDDMSGYAQTAQDLAVPVAAGVGGAVFAVALLLVVVRHLRVWLVAAMRAYWLYRRRWAAALEDLGLTETKGDVVKVPRLVKVTRYGSQDVVMVRMLPGQSAQSFHERAAALAAEFGAASALVRFGDVPHRDVVIVFDRSRDPRRELLALPAPQPHPLPLSLPINQQQRKAGPQMAIRLSGVQVQIVWARAQRTGENGRMVRIPARRRIGIWTDVRWCTTWATAN
jgi:hypothetical protein